MYVEIRRNREGIVRINTAMRRMLEGKPALGSVIGLGAPLIAELFSLAGCDYVMIDQQHGAWDDATTIQAFRSIMLGSAIPMARVPKNDYYAIGRVVDQGALGVIVPMVNSVEEAKATAFAVRYPPRGGRSWGPFGAGGYGADYGERVDEEILLLVQIETRQAAESAKEILSVEGVDGCWIGPNDLGKSLGVAPATAEGQQELERVIQGVLNDCCKVNKVPGIWAGGMARQRLDQGFQFVTMCNDEMLIIDGVKELLENLGEYRD